MFYKLIFKWNNIGCLIHFEKVFLFQSRLPVFKCLNCLFRHTCMKALTTHFTRWWLMCLPFYWSACLYKGHSSQKQSIKQHSALSDKVSIYWPYFPHKAAHYHADSYSFCNQHYSWVYKTHSKQRWQRSTLISEWPHNNLSFKLPITQHHHHRDSTRQQGNEARRWWGHPGDPDPPDIKPALRRETNLV